MKITILTHRVLDIADNILVHQVIFSTDDIDLEVLQEWCYKTFGESLDNPTSVSYWKRSNKIWHDDIKNGKIVFKDRKYYNMFIEKWT
jgi:hypothetical protein